MKDLTHYSDLEVGYDVPALPGMDEAEIQTPCLVLDLDALERNVKKMGDYAKDADFIVRKMPDDITPGADAPVHPDKGNFSRAIRIFGIVI